MYRLMKLVMKLSRQNGSLLEKKCWLQGSEQKVSMYQTKMEIWGKVDITLNIY